MRNHVYFDCLHRYVETMGVPGKEEENLYWMWICELILDSEIISLPVTYPNSLPAVVDSGRPSSEVHGTVSDSAQESKRAKRENV